MPLGLAHRFLRLLHPGGFARALELFADCHSNPQPALLGPPKWPLAFTC